MGHTNPLAKIGLAEPERLASPPNLLSGHGLEGLRSRVRAHGPLVAKGDRLPSPQEVRAGRTRPPTRKLRCFGDEPTQGREVVFVSVKPVDGQKRRPSCLRVC